MMTKRDANVTDDALAQPHTSYRTTASPTTRSCELLDYLQQTDTQRGTFLYLGYGSNLSKETFRGRRGIKPLSQVNVQVPTLRLTFDLPGIPYGEPCFANSGRRDPDEDRPSTQQYAASPNEKSPLLAPTPTKDRYHKDRWHKGLIGVVYEVTPEDYAHIIETEGGGASYHDITVDCHPLPSDGPEAEVPQDPTLPTFKAHTLFAPALLPDDPPPKDGGRFQRTDRSYAQPSARYLKLMTDGAAELGLPYEYQNYMQAIRPYVVTTARQRLGQFILLAMWGPLIFTLFGLAKVFSDKKGRSPSWLRALLGAAFKAVWISYDTFFKPTFGDGERSLSDGGGGGDDDLGRTRGRPHEGAAADHIMQEKDAIIRQMV